MIKTYTAYTMEIDDTELAFAEIAKQLDVENKMLKNTIGILACNYEFVLSGAAQEISRRLPFDVIGTVTTAQAVDGENGIGAMILTVMMLTSDDVFFETALTGSLMDDFESAIGEGYKAASAAMKGTPALILTLAPFITQNSGDAYVEVFSKLSPGTPCFGTMSVDDTSTFENCYIIHNGANYRDRMAVTLIYGDIEPRFYLATISQDKILGNPALITSSEGHILREVNGRPLVEYFDKLGLTNASETSYAMTSLPFMLDYNDGTPPVSRVFVALNGERHAVCAGAMPEGATLSIGVFDRQDVLRTTARAVEDALAVEGASSMLIYSCISRNMSLSGDMLAELELVKKTLNGRFEFMMAYSGGEFCPTLIDRKTAVNRFHNNTFIVCVF